MKHLSLTILLLCLLWAKNSQAQQSTVASGGSATGSGGTVSYSVGQISYKSPEGNLISDGVQQPYEIIALGTDEHPDLQLLAYPNPVTNILKLKNTDPKVAVLSYSLTDISGKILIQAQNADSTETTVSMQDYPAGIYLLQVFNQDKIVKTFKIIKK
ncbi:MAG: hypothetical protein CFE23_01875 [Flavobacterium sp. BFFFF1]|uniref:T9SS type A sorting domain-containing protein n=1 Tax=Flavobacterium sp. BFFFF1 TaxID=2015557 RepID=UPI000BD8E57C|nr:T9SS type A sorting domain-containing protein [Flavobacterium sp. BFFFF1]OYU82072.1 MAG: hypothetical protein CFE23_01875 [Flavobacterium sp. BFFFF1]